MYVVYAGNVIIHDPQLNDKTRMIVSPTLVKEVNKADSFTFTIYPSNAGYSQMTRMETGQITVYDDETLIFRGRILNDVRGWNNQLTVTCESDLAMLNDTVVRPYSFTGTVLQYLTQLITQHNSQVPAAKQFSLGSVTVTGNITRSATGYPTTMSELQDKLVSLLGGYISVRRSNNVNYIDYVLDSSATSAQTVELGKNLLSMAQTRKGEDIVTGIIPLGAKLADTDERLTIKSVNNNLDYLEDATAVAAYGKIYTTVTWDSETDASALKTKAQAKLTELAAAVVSIELTAADLHQVDRSIDDFAFFDYVTVNDTAHNMVGSYLITKKTIDLANPANAKITLGKDTAVSASERSAKTETIAENAVEEYGISSGHMNAAIKAATDLITGATGGYIKYHYNSAGQPTEILIMDAVTEAAATKIWRWNLNGLGYSSDGGETYDLAMTANGAIVADFITTGLLQSADADHAYSVNLETGAATLKSVSITGGSININTDSETDDKIQLLHFADSGAQYGSAVRPHGIMIGEREADGDAYATMYYAGTIYQYYKESGASDEHLVAELDALNGIGRLRFFDSSGQLKTGLNGDTGLTCHIYTAANVESAGSLAGTGASVTVNKGFYLVRTEFRAQTRTGGYYDYNSFTIGLKKGGNWVNYIKQAASASLTGEGQIYECVTATEVTADNTVLAAGYVTSVASGLVVTGIKAMRIG